MNERAWATDRGSGATVAREGRREFGAIAGQGPLHLIHEGGLVAFCRTKNTRDARHAGDRVRVGGVQVGMTSILPPTATAPRVAASQIRNQMRRGTPVSRW